MDVADHTLEQMLFLRVPRLSEFQPLTLAFHGKETAYTQQSIGLFISVVTKTQLLIFKGFGKEVPPLAKGSMHTKGEGSLTSDISV